MKHTPKPWHCRDVGYGINIEPDIAWIGFGTAHPKAEHTANSLLMVHSPDMAEALEKIADYPLPTANDLESYRFQMRQMQRIALDALEKVGYT